MKTIYLTGTVNDMQAEYEAIKSVVMPQINAFLKEEYDEEATLMGFGDTSDDEGCRKELKSCFRELKKGDAYFVSLLSDRYGNVPPSDVTDGFLEKVGIHADENVIGCSVMEIETLYAALNDPEKALVYFREPFTKKEIAGPMHKVFAAGFGEGRKVKKLKSTIRKMKALTIHEYKLETVNGVPTEESANALASRIAEDLKLLIAADMNKKAKAAEQEEAAAAVETETAEERAEDVKIPENKMNKGPINLNKVETPVWNALKEGSAEKYNPEELRNEAVAVNKNAAMLEQSDPERAGDLYDDAMEMFRRLRKDAEAGHGAFDDTLDKVQQVLVTDEVVRDMGLTYFAYARIEFNSKNFEGAAAWGKQAIDSLTGYQQKYNKIETIIDLSNVWMLMSAALANGGNPIEAIDAVSAAISCYDGLAHNKNFKAPEDFGTRYKSIAQLAHTICINEKTGEAAKKWLTFCQQQSFQLSKMGDNAGMINYVNFSIGLCEYQIYQQNNKENMYRYLNMIHEIAQLFLRERNEPMLKLLVDKGRNLMEVAPNDERVTDIVCSMISLQANIFFSTLRHEEALANYTEVVDMRKDYKNSLDTQKRIVIAADYARRASAYTELNRLAEAEEGYDEAISILKSIKSKDNDERICGELASAYMNRSVCLGKQDRIEEAKESIDTAYKYVDGRKLTQQNLVILKRRIRRMKQITESENPKAMYGQELMKQAKAEMDKLRDANEYVKKQEFEKAAGMIEEALLKLKELMVVDIVIPSEGYAANLAACGSIYQDKLNNEVKGASMLKAAWAVLVDMEKDGLRLNAQLVNNLKTRLKIK
ncbi:MAG: DUF4062 domain-containing protein [bacterium]|nr:DUF4062 domain-containing protein [bacterium]